MSTSNYMDISTPQSSQFWDSEDTSPESPSILHNRQTFYNNVELIKTKIQQKAPLYISSDQYGSSKILQVKIQSLDDVLRIISSVVNEFGLLLPPEQDDLYSFTKLLCSEPAESPVQIQEQSQLESYFHFPDRESQEKLPSSTASILSSRSQCCCSIFKSIIFSSTI